jgi:hypothetical protein
MSIWAMSAATGSGVGVGSGEALAVGVARTTLEAAGADVAGDVPHAAADASVSHTNPTASAARIRLLNAREGWSVR